MAFPENVTFEYNARKEPFKRIKWTQWRMRDRRKLQLDHTLLTLDSKLMLHATCGFF